MKFKNLSGREISIDILPSRYPVQKRGDSKSDGQYLLGRLIQSIYGIKALMLEEFSIPDERLFIDFFLPHHKLAFEFQGVQHDKYVKFFHGTKKGFKASQKRDARKRQWCELNDIILIEVRETLTVDDLRTIITEARDG